MPATQAIKLIKPRALKEGDRIGLVSPASRPESPAVVQRAVRVVEEMGFKAVVGTNVLKMHGFMAGTDAERLSDLNGFIVDDTIDGIFCLTGGFGSLHLLPDLNYSALRKNPKVIVGGDDNCALVLAIQSRTGLVTFAGPNIDKIDSDYTFLRFKQAVTSAESLPPISSYEVNSDRFMHHVYSPVSGTVSGALLGGNLTALVSLMGTPFQPRFSGSILFLEDLDERHDILDRWFTTLYVSGELSKVYGIAFGAFEGCNTKNSRNMLSLEDLFGDRLRQLNKPSCFAMPLGQCKQTTTVPLGVQVTLHAADGRIQFGESACM
jgi:muramoyltetrapeptide carboxypeptidase